MNGIQKLIARLFGIKAFDYRGQYTIQNGRLVSISDNTESYIKKGYDINDMVSTVINIQTDKIKIAPWGLYKIVDKSSLKKRNSLLSKKNLSRSDIQQINKYQQKALELVETPSRWTALLEEPCSGYSFGDFVSHACGFNLLTGNTYIWASKLDAGADKGKPFSLHIMPSQYVKIVATDGFPGRVTGYELTTSGMRSIYSAEDVIHIKTHGYNYNASGDQFYGQSKLRSAIKLINRSNSALDASTAQFQNSGPGAIIYNDEPQMDVNVAIEQAERLKLKMIQEYSGPENHGKIAISPYKAGVALIGLSPRELQILEGEKWDLVRFASVYGVPPELVGYTGTKTYDNIKTAEKALTNRCAIPQLTSFRDGFNSHAHKHLNLPGEFIYDFGLEPYSELSEDMGEMMEWVSVLADTTGMPINKLLEILGQETIPDVKEFDEPRITDKMGRFISEYRNNSVDDALSEDLNEEI